MATIEDFLTLDIRVGLPAGSKRRAAACEAGLRVMTPAEAAREADVIMVLSDVALAVLLYVILAPVSRTVALTATAFRLVQTAILGNNLLSLQSALRVLNGAEATFETLQFETLASFALDAHEVGMHQFLQVKGQRGARDVEHRGQRGVRQLVGLDPLAVDAALGQAGVNIMDFCKNFNARTAKDEGLVIPVVVTIFADRSYSFITKTPPAAILLKKVANLAKGSAEPNRNKVGTVTEAQVEDIAKQKLPDLNCQDLDAAVRTVRGTARSMGIDVV